MKHFLHSGCLLKSVFEVELKMSSFSVPEECSIGGEIVIQIEERKEKTMKRAMVGLCAAFCFCTTDNSRQDIGSRLICHVHIFMV